MFLIFNLPKLFDKLLGHQSFILFYIITLIFSQVVVYRPQDDSKQFDQHSTILPHPKHRQFGSYFGATLLSMDLNNDGKDDLLVGAPLYIGKDSDEGRVFVYVSDDSGQSQINWASLIRICICVAL